MKFIHAADIHLDSPLLGLERYEGAPAAAIRAATRRAVEAMVDLALAEQVSFVVIAGDVYDGDWKDYNTGLFFAAQLSRLRRAQIPVCLINGNHDAQSVVARHLRLPDNTHVLDTASCESVIWEQLGVAIHGQGFSTRHCPQDLSAGYPPAVEGLFNLGLLHTSLDGRPGHEPYAPCTVEGLAEKGYDYWALGHVHAREQVLADPWIGFSGNIQGRHARELGPKGVVLATVEDAALASAEYRDCDVVRWDRLDIDARGSDTEDDLLQAICEDVARALQAAGDRLVCLRVAVHGASGAHDQYADDIERFKGDVRAACSDIAQDQVWIEKLEVKTQTAIDTELALADGTAMTELAECLAELAADSKTLSSVDPELAALKKRLPQELKRRGEPCDFDDPAELERLLAEVKQLVVPQLVQETQSR